MAANNGKAVLFVCLGNICRSPIAEAVFRKLATDNSVVAHWRIDSAATSTYEIGNPPDHRGQACMRKHGTNMSHVARQWVIDSGAVSDWNVGCSPDARALACLRNHGIETDHRARQWRIDSAATSTYEIGNPPDHRGQACMRKHGTNMSHVARQVTKDDFATFDHILCMDESNLSLLFSSEIQSKLLEMSLDQHSSSLGRALEEVSMEKSWAQRVIGTQTWDLKKKASQVKNCKAKIELLGSYDPQKQLIIQDPYYGNEEDFETVYEQCVRCCKAFLENYS
ncbi:UNVERIFIED_CONTAM: hypothetical protein FKN15_065368 [Acipenser sinensis]